MGKHDETREEAKARKKKERDQKKQDNKLYKVLNKDAKKRLKEQKKAPSATRDSLLNNISST